MKVVARTGSDPTDLADVLWRAEVDRVAVEPLTTSRPDLSAAEAYAIQTRNVERAPTTR